MSASVASPRRTRRATSPRVHRGVLTLAGVLLVPAVAFAHAVVYPRESTPGAYEKYVLRVPNERAVPTTRVELRFPPEVRVVSLADVPGWTLEVMRDSARRVTGAAWTGTLPPERFVEFPFVAVNPASDTRLVWPATQIYSDGERVEWAGPEGSERPASATVIAAPAGPARSGWASYVEWAALLLALIALGLVLRPRTAS